MQLLSTNPRISNATIPLLLQWWQQRKRLASSSGVLSSPVLKDTDDAYLEACHRMMEIYAVVKAGGVKAQREAAEAHLQREQAAIDQALGKLRQQPASSDTAMAQAQLQAEAQELASAVDWRLSALKQIDAAEETAVVRHLRDIERVLMR
ncbi:MAG: hypothetical protein AAFZ80_01490 [Cyanobacteria bacterium P01_A01_bin.105]